MTGGLLKMASGFIEPWFEMSFEFLAAVGGPGCNSQLFVFYEGKHLDAISVH